MKIPGLAVLLCLAATTTTFALKPGTILPPANQLNDGYSYVIKNVVTQTVLDLAGIVNFTHPGNHSGVYRMTHDIYLSHGPKPVTGWSPKDEIDNINQRVRNGNDAVRIMN
jgi:hypothetical protein